MIEIIKKLLEKTPFVPVEGKNMVEIWEIQKDGEKIPAGYFFKMPNTFLVDIFYLKDSAIITEDGFSERDIKEHVERELKELVEENMKKKGYVLSEQYWIQAGREEDEVFVMRFKKLIRVDQIPDEIEEIEKLKEELEIF